MDNETEEGTSYAPDDLTRLRSWLAFQLPFDEKESPQIQVLLPEGDLRLLVNFLYELKELRTKYLTLKDAARVFRDAFVIAVGAASPFAKHALSIIDKELPVEDELARVLKTEKEDKDEPTPK